MLLGDFFQIPDTISKLDQLEILVLSWNQLSNINQSLCRFPKLIILDISNNDVFYIASEISELQSLQQLILNGNRLEAIPLSISDLKCLHVLGLNENNLAEVC